MKEINVTKLHAELEKVGIPIEGVSSDGRIDFLPTATEEQKAQAAAILAAHDPVDVRSLRRAEYPSVAEQLEALWAGGEVAVGMKARIEAINAKYPLTDE